MRRNGTDPFNLNDWIEKMKLSKAAERKFIGLFFSTIVLVWLVFTSFYTVEPDEQAVVLRFGKYVETTDPGLHFKAPMGVDEAVKVKTKLILQAEFGFRSSGTDSDGRTEYSQKNFDEESLMLTGDLNVADVEWTVQFQIADPQMYLFQIRDPIANIRDISQAIMRRVVGDRLVTEVLTVGRIEIGEEARSLMQELMDRYKMGLRVVAVKLQDVNPPEPVKASFNEVNSAKQVQEQLINQSEKSYNEVIPKARGEADQKISEAKGYAAALVNRAEGDAQKFSTILKEYRRAPKVTEKRMYLDAIESVMSNMDSITIVDPEIQGLLPIFSDVKISKASEPEEAAKK